jgi:outer membrane protein assembly factor BamB
MTREEWLKQYHALDERRAELEREYEAAEATGNYAYVDEARADLNEVLADLADHAATILEEETAR